MQLHVCNIITLDYLVAWKPLLLAQWVGFSEFFFLVYEKGFNFVLLLFIPKLDCWKYTGFNGKKHGMGFKYFFSHSICDSILKHCTNTFETTELKKDLWEMSRLCKYRIAGKRRFSKSFFVFLIGECYNPRNKYKQFTGWAAWSFALFVESFVTR